MKPAMLIALMLCIGTAHAFTYNERGIKTYKKLCKECHGSEFRGAAMLTASEWKEVFANDGARMIALHKENTDAMENLERSYYVNRKKYLAEFLIKNAKDSGTVPGCDSNYCGY